MPVDEGIPHGDVPGAVRLATVLLPNLVEHVGEIFALPLGNLFARGVGNFQHPQLFDSSCYLSRRRGTEEYEGPEPGQEEPASLCVPENLRNLPVQIRLPRMEREAIHRLRSCTHRKPQSHLQKRERKKNHTN